MKGIFNTILVPHDLSNHANRALKIAANLATRPGRLIVLHVANQYGNARVQRSVLEDARLRLERAVSRALGDRDGLAIERRVVHGNPYAQITQAALDADSVIMCTAGRTGLSHLVIGSVAEKVVRYAPRPVLSFRPGVAWPTQLFGRIVVPHDFSRHATRALKMAASFAGPKGHLCVLHVVSDLPEGVNRRTGRRVFASERRRLRHLIARTVPTRRGPAVRCRVESGHPYQHIVEAARQADLIVMCTAGRTGFPRLVIGSIAEKIVRHAPVPVLTFRPAAAIGRRTRPNPTAHAFNHGRAVRRPRRS